MSGVKLGERKGGGGDRGSGKMIEEYSGVERQIRPSQNCYNTHYIRKTCLELSWERKGW